VEEDTHLKNLQHRAPFLRDGSPSQGSHQLHDMLHLRRSEVFLSCREMNWHGTAEKKRELDLGSQSPELGPREIAKKRLSFSKSFARFRNTEPG
jgi:hypothetical protein